MSLHMMQGMARLTVLGHGWNNDASIISGSGFTFDGDLWKDVAGGLNYSFPDGVEWDTIADSEFELNHSNIIYTGFDGNTWTDPFSGDIYPGGGEAVFKDFDGNLYFDFDGDGIWVDPDTGNIYDGNGTLNYTLPDDLSDITGVYTNPLNNDTWTDPTTGMDFNGIGDMWVPESMLANMSNSLTDIAASDAGYGQYNIPQNILDQIRGGPIGIEQQSPSAFGDLGPHTYTPPAYVVQKTQTLSYVFNAEVFQHSRADGYTFDIDDTTIVIRDGSSKTVYYGACNTHNYDTIIPSPYNNYPIAYICWQCLYGPFSDYLIVKTDDTITTEDIENGTTGKDTMTIAGERYYRMKAEQVKDRI